MGASLVPEFWSGASVAQARRCAGMLAYAKPDQASVLPGLAPCRYCNEKGLPAFPNVVGRGAKLEALRDFRVWEPAVGSPLDAEERLLLHAPSKYIVRFRRAKIAGVNARSVGRGASLYNRACLLPFCAWV